MIDETAAYMALIRDNIEYEHHMKYDQYGDKEMYGKSMKQSVMWYV